MTPRYGERIAYVFAAGALFACLQTGYFFQLQFWMTAAYPTYLTITLAWLLGSVAGLWLGQRGSGVSRIAWVPVSVSAYYLALLLLRCFPYHTEWLPLCGLLIAISGLQAGHFFAVNRALFDSASRLFFWENNGFVLGWIAGFLGYAWLGSAFHWTTPAALGLIVTGLNWRMLPPEEVGRWLTSERRNQLLLHLIGFNLILLSYTLIRQMTIAFHDLEKSALIMALAYFAGISLGYLKSDRLSGGLVKNLLPLFLVLQILLASVSQILIHLLVASCGDTFAYIVVFVLLAVGSTSLYSVFLPSMIQSSGEGSTRRCYSAEILGSLCGLVMLFPLSLAGLVAAYAAYFASFMAIALLLNLRPRMLVIMSVYVAAFLLGFDAIDKTVSTAFYRQSLAVRGVDRVLYTRYSPYHKVEVVRLQNNDRLLLLNAQLQFGPAAHHNYSYFAAEYPARLLKPRTVCVIGCGSMSTVGRIGNLADSIMIVDLDRAVFDTAKVYFARYNRLAALHNWTFRCDDGKHFLATTSGKYDLMIDDLPPAKTRQVALTYTTEFFELVKAHLTPRGIFSLPSLTSMNSSRAYGRRILATLSKVFDQVYVLNDGSTSYYFAAGQGVVFDRDTLRSAIDHPHRDSIDILLPGEARERVRRDEIITINNLADLILY